MVVRRVCALRRLDRHNSADGGRRRLVQRLPHSELATFSSRFMRWHVLIFALQAGIGIWAMVNTATARTAEDAVLTKKINYALRAVSLFFSMTPGLHAIIFTAAGVSHQTFKSGKAPVATYVAAALVVAYIAVVAFDVAIVFSAQTSTDAILGVHGVIELFGLENVPMMGVWLCAAYQFGLKFGHLRNFDETEERLDAKRQAGAKGGAEGEASAGTMRDQAGRAREVWNGVEYAGDGATERRESVARRVL